LVNNLEMNLPSAPVPQPTNAVPRKPSQIVVTSAGRITLDGQPHDLASLRPALSLLKKGDPELALVVRGAAATEYQHVVAVLDLVQQLDITRVGLATEQ
jgi:biopolymer transport protein ExbD